MIRALRSNLRDALNQLLPIAEDLDVDLCMENVWNGFFYSPIELRDFVDSFTSDKLGVYLDIGNLIGYQQYPPHWIELLNSRIKRVQVKDFQENFDWTGSFSFCDLGAGDVPWKETIDALKVINYQNTIIAEMLPWDETILSRTSAAMDQLFDFNTSFLNLKTMTKKLKVGIIGLGSMGSTHLDIYSQISDVEVIAVADSIQSRLDGSSKAKGNISGQARGGVGGLKARKYIDGMEANQ